MLRGVSSLAQDDERPTALSECRVQVRFGRGALQESRSKQLTLIQNGRECSCGVYFRLTYRMAVPDKYSVSPV